MKKVLTILLVLTCLLGLVGCDPGKKGINKNEVLDNTVKIELVHYENKRPKSIYIDEKKVPTFDFSKVTPIATLDDSSIEDVVKDVAGQDFLLYNRVLSEPVGKTLILYQRNGNMIVLCGCVYENKLGITKYYGQGDIFDENGIFVEHLGDISSTFVDKIESKYFNSNS